MNQNDFMKLTWEEKVNRILGERDNLDEECFCETIGKDADHPKYTLTVNSNPPVTEYTVCTWDEEEEIDLDDLLDEYGVYDWTDLPDHERGCRFCPMRYDCEVVKKAVEQFKPLNKEEIEKMWEGLRIGPYNDKVTMPDGFAEEHEGEDEDEVVESILELFRVY